MATTTHPAPVAAAPEADDAGSRRAPPVLREDASLRHRLADAGDAARVGGGCDNRLIQGDNLRALEALEGEFGGRIKCVYIDPPYNSGGAFAHYDDDVAHAAWLGALRERAVRLRRLLRDDGVLFASIGDDEQAYLKVLL